MAKLAKIANEAVEKIDSKLECSICLDNFKEPKLLPCFHIFCKSPCLERLVVRDHQRLTLTCPTCRHLVTLSDNGVNGLQTDFHIEHLFEIRQALEKAKNMKCDNCLDLSATIYCNNCRIILCDKCTQTHNEWRKNSGHKIMCIDEVDGVEKFTPTKQPLMCDKHNDMEAKIYCETCADIICSDCTIRLHRDHDYDLTKDVFHKHKIELLKTLEQLKTNLATVKKSLAIFATKTQEVTDKRVAVEADIHREIDQLHTLLDQQREELVANLNMLTRQKLKELATKKDHVELTQVKMSSCLEYAEAGLETGTESEVLKMKTPVMKHIEQIMTEFDPNTTQPQIEADFELVSDNVQKAYKNISDITINTIHPESSYARGDGTRFAQAGKYTLVEVHPRTRHQMPYKELTKLTAEITHAKTKTTIKCDVQQSSNQYAISYQPILKGRHTLSIHINGQHIRDSPYNVVVSPSAGSLQKPRRVVTKIKPHGTVYNSTQQLIVADRYSSNAIIVLLDDNTKQKIFDMDEIVPSRVAVDHEDNIYITSHQNNCIFKISPKGKILESHRKNHSYSLDGPLGIIVNKNNHYLYVCDQCNHRILVLTTKLKLLQTFGTHGYENGQFNNPRNVAFDSSDNLYVTDTGNDRVQVFTADGQFLRTFADKINCKKIESPYAIVIDSNDIVYISAWNSHCISIFTAEGEYIMSFEKQGRKKGYIFGLSVGQDDAIVVSDTDNNQLQLF